MKNTVQELEVLVLPLGDEMQTVTYNISQLEVRLGDLLYFDKQLFDRERKTSDKQDIQRSGHTAKSTMNILNNNIEDSNEARSSVLHNIKDNIKHNDIDNGGNGNNTDNEGYNENFNNNYNIEQSLNNNHNAIGFATGGINDTNKTSQSDDDDSSRFSNGSIKGRKSDEGCNKNKTSMANEKSNVNKSDIDEDDRPPDIVQVSDVQRYAPGGNTDITDYALTDEMLIDELPLHANMTTTTTSMN